METANSRPDGGGIQFNICCKSKKWSVVVDVRKIASCGRISVIFALIKCVDSCHHLVSKCWRSVWFQPPRFVVVQVFATGCNDVTLAVRFKTLQHESASGSRGLGRPLKPRRFGGNPGRGRIERERNSFGVPIPGERPGRPPLLVALPSKDHHRYFLAGIPSRILRLFLRAICGSTNLSVLW